MTGEHQALQNGLWAREDVGSIGRMPFTTLCGQLPHGHAPRRACLAAGWMALWLEEGAGVFVPGEGLLAAALWFPSSAGSRQVPGLGAPVPRRWARPICAAHTSCSDMWPAVPAPEPQCALWLPGTCRSVTP